MSNPSSREELLFEICESREELQQHIKTFLKIDLPDYIVDENSTSTAMDFVWEIYNLMRTGKGPQRHVVAASRNSAKTLTACIIRFYSMIHFRRTGTHLAATMDQSQSAIGYLDKFLAIPEVHKYISTDNTRTKELKGLPPNSHTRNDTCKLRVSVATKKGVNSQRGSLNMRDETDLLPPAIISESVFIADPTQDEHRFGPIEIDLSSRKTNDGPMQQKIDEAEGKDPPPDLKLHKWSAVDWMRECPTEIHKPDLPKIKAWLNTDNLKITWDEEIFKRLPKTEQTLNQEVECFEGCKSCPAFVVCQGRSPKQKSKSRMLRDIAFVSLILKGVNSAEAIIAQALNLKPESSSVVFKTFRRHRHFLKPHEFYKFITGVYWNPERMTEEEIEDGLDRDDLLTLIKITPDKDVIYKALVDLGWDINYGVDWGYNPASAVCIVGAYHRRQKRAVVLHVASSHEYANVDWAAYIAKNIWSQYPGDLVCPDMADPASPSYFGKHKMPCLDYKPSKIETGVSQLRSLLWNPGAQTEMFALLDDGDMGENWKLAEAFEKWTYKKTPIGFDYDKFEDNDFCDYLDPCRYGMAPFIEESHISVLANQNRKNDLMTGVLIGDKEAVAEYQRKQEFQTQFAEHMQSNFGVTDPFGTKVTDDKGKDKSRKGGSIKFRM